jgi:hypothetical protein
MRLSRVLKVFLTLLSLLYFTCQSSAAIPFKLGAMAEPGFEYTSLQNLKETFKGFNIPFQVQALFLNGQIKPFLGLGYNYQDIWTKTNKTLGFSNHSLLIEAGANFILNHKYSLDAFLGYNFAFSPDIYTKKDGDNVSKELDYYRKLRLGARLFYSLIDGLDIGLSSAFVFGFLKSKDYFEGKSMFFGGLQLNLSLMKSFDFEKLSQL